MEKSGRWAKCLLLYNAALFMLLTLLQFVALELFFGQLISDFSIILILKNILLMGVCNLILLAVSQRFGLTFMVTSVLFMVIGMANYFVNLFRGYGIVFMDFYAAKTVATVAGHYNFKVGGYFYAGMAVNILCIIICAVLIIKKKEHKYKIIFSLMGLIASASFIAWINLDAVFLRGVDSLKWDHAIGIHDYGYPLYFIANAGTASVEMPTGYSVEKVDLILSRYAEAENNNNIAGNEDAPNLIMIMDEAYSDLRVLGSINADVPPWEFVDGLKENTVKGFAVSSVYGGYTSNSEFEFLTGASKVFLPGNPYLQYVTGHVPSLITDIKKNTVYNDAVAIHPYNGSGYNRNRVYPLFSFDRFLTIDDFGNAECIRDYVSDSADFGKITKMYEEKEVGEKLCVFNVTMQNHNPYDDINYTYKNQVHMILGGNGNFEANRYLSLIKETDNAIKELIEYFSRAEEPTVILIYGDHQPHLPDEFYEQVTGKTPMGMTAEDSIRKNFVPYIIWANYDLQDMFAETAGIPYNAAWQENYARYPDEDTKADVSLNYLRLIFKKAAGLPFSDYDRFLYGLHEVFPVISPKGCLDAEGKLYQVDELEDEKRERMREYEMVQYYYLFDDDGTEKIRNHFIPY